MYKIYKYPFEIKDEFIIEMPYDSKILNAFCQNDIPCMWALVNPQRKLQKRKFTIIGTGHPIEETYNLEHISTFSQSDGKFIWHLFEIV
jgi:hypothetical protein